MFQFLGRQPLVVAGMLFLLGAIAGFPALERAHAVEIPGMSVIVSDDVLIDPTYGGVIGGYTYDTANDAYYVTVYGSSQGLRKVTHTGPGGTWEADTYAGVSFESYPSDMMRFARSSDVAGGVTDPSTSAFSMMAGILLNPTTVTRTVKAPENYVYDANNPLMNYGPVDADGNITITYAPGTLAYIVDGGYDESSGSRLDSKKIFTWDLRQIGTPTDSQLDYNTGTSGSTTNPNPGGLFGAYGQADWNDVFSVVMTEQQLRNAYTAYQTANPSLGMPDLPDSSVDNFGRQFAWSTDGQSLYCVDKGYDIGGVYKVNASTGEAEMLHVEMSNSMYSEPSVVATSALDFGSGVGAGDQVIFNGTAYTGNPGGLSYVVDTGSGASGAKTLVHGDMLQTQLGTTASGTITYTAADSDGDVYFWNSSAGALFRRDAYGRVSKVVSKAEAYELAYEHDGTRGNGGGLLRLQTREDETGTHVTFRGDNSYIGAVQIFDPADLNKDGSVTQEDRDQFIAQRRAAMLGDVPSASSDPDGYADYLAADISGDLAVDSDGVIERGSVDNMDTLLYFQHINEKPGDLNLDGTVSAAEVAMVEANIGVSGSWFQGDFDRDGIVTQTDVDMMAAAGTTYDITAVEPTASYTGGVNGTWADVKKPSGIEADADSLITLARDGGATVVGASGRALAGFLTIGSANETYTGATELQLAAGSQLDVALGMVVTGKGVLDGSATGAGIKLGLPGYGATLIVEDGGQLQGSFTLEGSLRLNTSTSQDLYATVTDTDVASFLAKNGSGTLTVYSTNSYTGETRIEGGTLVVGTAGAIPAVSSLYVGSDATLDLNGYDVTVGGMDSDDSDFSVPQILLGAKTLTYDSDDDGSFVGDISGTGDIVKNGAGQFSLNAQTSFTGGVTVNEGTLRLYADNALVTTSEVTVNEDGVLGLYRADQELAALHGTGEVTNTYTGTSSSSAYDTNLTLNTADGTANTFDGRITSARMAVEKKGLGTLVLNGQNTFSNGLTIAEGTVEVSSNGNLGAEGGEVTVAENATLVASGNILGRHVGGVRGSTLTAKGTLLIGDASSTTGFDFGGVVNVGSHLVGLIDADQAELHGATIAGGTLSSLTSIQMAVTDTSDINTALTGYGTVNGKFTAGASGQSGAAFVIGDASNGGITMTGTVNGNGVWQNVTQAGLFTAGFSPGYNLFGENSSLNATIVEIGGDQAAVFNGAATTPGDYDQGYVYGMADGSSVAYDGFQLLGKMTIQLIDSFLPELGDEFLLFETGEFDVFGTHYGTGEIVYGEAFDLDLSNAVLADGLAWHVDATSEHLMLSVQAVPEPGTIVMLLGCAVAAGVYCQRKRRARAV